MATGRGEPGHQVIAVDHQVPDDHVNIPESRQPGRQRLARGCEAHRPFGRVIDAIIGQELVRVLFSESSAHRRDRNHGLATSQVIADPVVRLGIGAMPQLPCSGRSLLRRDSVVTAECTWRQKNVRAAICRHRFDRDASV